MEKASKWLFYLSLALVIYMPLHVFIVQSASLLTGGIEAWKAAKDVLLVLLVPLLLYISYQRGFFEDKFFRLFIVFGGLYTLLHGIFTLFFHDFTGLYASIIGSVYNTRILGFFLLGYIVGKSDNRKRYIQILLTSTVFIAVLVAVFGILQYFLPTDLLEHVGYSVERGVKPLFFIDDKPDLPRVMSTLKDPNSLGAYLIIPMLLTIAAFIKEKWNKQLFVRPLRKSVLITFLLIFNACMLLTFSRGALLSFLVALSVFLGLVYGRQVLDVIKRFWWIGLVAILLVAGSAFVARDTYVFKNVVFHADEATTKANPNEKRLILYEEAIDNITDRPVGYGPGSAGIVSVKSDNGQRLTENYALQILHEVGIVGLVLFVILTGLILMQLFTNRGHVLSVVMLASLVGYLFYGLLVHIWSNEAVALQWWLLAGLSIAASGALKRT